MNAIAQVKVDVSISGLIKNLSSVFASKTTFIKELMQNSRRAGATEISISLVQTIEGNLEVNVQDNGHGVKDFSTMLRLAESNWDSSIDSEKPFGMGFFSALLAGEQTSVSSLGQRLVVNREAMLEPIQLFNDEHFAGTRISILIPCGSNRIKEFAESLTKVIEREASWIPVNVLLNGQTLDQPIRPHIDMVERDGFLVVEMPDIGRARVALSARIDRLMVISGGSAIFMNGSCHHSYFENYGTIIQVDPSSDITVRMPDREALIDHEESTKKLLVALDNALLARFEQDIKSDGDDAAIAKWSDILQDISIRSSLPRYLNLLNVIPSFFIQPASNYDGITSTLEHPTCSTQHVTREQLSAPGVRVLSSWSPGACFAIGKKLNWYVFNGSQFQEAQHEDYWLSKHPAFLKQQDIDPILSTLKINDDCVELSGGAYYRTFFIDNKYQFTVDGNDVFVDSSFQCQLPDSDVFDDVIYCLTSIYDVEKCIWEEREGTDDLSENDVMSLAAALTYQYERLTKVGAKLMASYIDASNIYLGDSCTCIIYNGKPYDVKPEHMDLLKTLIIK